MATTAGFLNGLDTPVTPGGTVDGLSSSKRTTNALTNKLSSVLSSSYTDPEIRDALRLLDERGLQNDEDTRRDLKANSQRDVIKCNAMIVDDFGQVAEVRVLCPNQPLLSSNSNKSPGTNLFTVFSN